MPGWSQHRFQNLFADIILSTIYVLNRLIGALSTYQSLYLGIILIMYGIFIFSLYTLIAGYILTPLFEIAPIIAFKIVEILRSIPLGMGDAVIRTSANILETGEIIDRNNMLALMATTLSVVTGFYGVISQLYTGQWGGWITLRRTFSYLKKSGYKCDTCNGKKCGGRDLVDQHIDTLLKILFPANNNLIAITFDQAIVGILILAFVHFLGIIYLGASGTYPSALELVIFVMLLAASIVLVLLSVLVKPPLAVYLAQQATCGPFMAITKTPHCLPSSAGIFCLTRDKRLFYLATLVFLLAAVVAYSIDPVRFSGMNILRLGIGAGLYMLTAILISILIGIININYIFGTMSKILRKISAIDLKIKKKILQEYGKKPLKSKILSKICQAVLYWKEAIVITFLLIYIYVYVNDIALDSKARVLFLYLGTFVLFTGSALYATYFVVRRRYTITDFGFYLRYAEQLLEQLQRNVGGMSPARPVLLIELLVVEIILSLMILVATAKKGIAGLQLSMLPLSRERSEIVRSIEEAGARFFDSLFYAREKREVLLRFYIPMADLESYFAHAAALSRYIAHSSRSWSRKGGEGEDVQEPILVQTAIVTSIGLIAVYHMGRLRSYTYPKALLSISHLLLRIRKTSTSLGEHYIHMLDQLIPQLISILVVLVRIFPEAICEEATRYLSEEWGECTCDDGEDGGRKLSLRERLYYCHFAVLTIGPCLEIHEYREKNKYVLEMCPGIARGPTL